MSEFGFGWGELHQLTLGEFNQIISLVDDRDKQQERERKFAEMRKR